MKIEFYPVDEDTENFVPPPQPAKLIIPEWYKKLPRFYNGEGPKFKDGGVYNNTLKACYPFYDSLSAGYIQNTWCDIHISFTEDREFRYTYSSFPEIVSHREITDMPLLQDFWNVEFLWKIRWVPRLPEGWSALFVSPLNRLELPFHSLSAIVDSDVFYASSIAGSYPFFIKKNYNNFIIPAGTPMYQIIPIKRENWKSKYMKLDKFINNKITNKVKKNFIGSYKRNFRHNKKYS